VKPPPFIYHRPKTLDDALAVLAKVAPEDGRILAGGQTLVPMMALRVAYPPHLVDINGVAELDYLDIRDDMLAIGALTRHARFEEPVDDGPTGRILAEIVRHIAHMPIRSRGTMCGSLVNADPASEWCLTAATLGAMFVARSRAGTREIKAAEYFLDIMTTALEPAEILAEVRLPRLAADSYAGFYEFSRRAGDFALGMSLVTYRLADGVIVEPRIGVGAAETHPRRIAEAEAVLLGQAPTAAAFAKAAAAAAAAVEPMEDHVADGDYRRELVQASVRRALDHAAHSQDRERH